MNPNEMVVETEPLAVKEQTPLGLSICPGSTRARGDGLPKSQVDPLDESSSEKPEDKLDLFGTGFQIVQRCVDPAGEDFGTSLALEALNAVMRAVPNQRMNRAVGHTVIVTAGVTREWRPFSCDHDRSCAARSDECPLWNEPPGGSDRTGSADSCAVTAVSSDMRGTAATLSTGH